MNYRLQDRVAIVTGASGGIGLGIAEAYAREGSKVCLAARNNGALAQAASRIASAGGKAIAVRTDVTSEDEVAHVFAETASAFGQIDILVNNAGVSHSAPSDELSLEAWRHVIDVNVTGAFLCCREAMRHMKPKRRGRIINIGSVAAKVPRPDSVAYATSKRALEGMTHSLAVDGRPFGIAVSVLQPGNTETPILDDWTQRAEQEGVMQVEDVAEVAVTMAALPDTINFFESVVLPIKMPLLGRG